MNGHVFTPPTDPCDADCSNSPSPLEFREWDPDAERSAVGTNHGPVLVDPLTAQVGQSDLYVDIHVFPSATVCVSAALLPGDTVSEMRVVLSPLTAEAAMAFARALVWAARTAATMAVASAPSHTPQLDGDGVGNATETAHAGDAGNGTEAQP